VNKETRRTIVAVAAVAVVIGVAYAGLLVYAGTSSPFYTVESGSMSHTDGSRSQIGIIDTGDMVFARDPSKMSVTTYVDGHETGYKRFGDYGDVVIYNRSSGLPVIHRAIVYAESNGDGTWSIPSLATYTGVWKINDVPGDPGNVDALSGKLSFEGFGYNGRSFDVNLDALIQKSGYVTMGDANSMTDQGTTISKDALIGQDSIVAVAAHEIPWLGAIKMYITGNNAGEIPSNTLPSLIIAILLIFSAIAAICIVYERVLKKK